MEEISIGVYCFMDDGTITKNGQQHGGKKPNSDGYLVVCLLNKQLKVHRVIASLFVPNPMKLDQVNHINGIKTDNRAINLEWCTQADNMRHAMKTGLTPPVRGSVNGMSKLKEQQVIEIKKELSEFKRGMLTQLSKKYNVTVQAIGLIRSGKNWGHL